MDLSSLSRTVKKPTEIISRTIKFLSNDPKAVFDHVRNVGIAGAIILGAGLLRAKTSATHVDQPFTAYIPTAILFIGGTLLLVMNLLYAQTTITKKILGENTAIGIIEKLKYAKRLIKARNKLSKDRRIKALNNITEFHLKELGAQTLLFIYYIFIATLIFTQSFSTPKADIDKKIGPDNVNYLNLEKLNSTLSSILEKNKTLEIELFKTKIELENKSKNIIDLKNQTNKAATPPPSLSKSLDSNGNTSQP